MITHQVSGRLVVRPQLPSTNTRTAKNIGVNWAHIFNPSTFLQVQIGHTQSANIAITEFRSLPANFYKNVGWDDSVTKMIDGSTLAPAISVTDFFSATGEK